MTRSLRSSTVARIVSTVAVALILAGVLYWRSQASQPPGEASEGAIVRAGAPHVADDLEAFESQSTTLGAADSAELPVLATTNPAAAPGGTLPETDLRDESRAVPDAVSSGLTDAKDDKFEPLDAESDGAESRSPKQELAPSAQLETYTWHDGARTIKVWLDPNLAVVPGGDDVSRDDIVASVGEDVVVRGEAAAAAPVKGDPVFWSDSGELMALPGGAVVVLDASWDTAAVDGFFERNGVDTGRLSELDFVANGFYITTDPGLASLELANALASHPGVELSSPDWWIERVAK
ncbi:hypothetical protein [Candidatus Poriferisodalis sp.]|uniref:hypothetical protein n=1 Tax=Candidatus Poriferisodalis sp. TaxID=3101277 RepID=UPI003B516237